MAPEADEEPTGPRVVMRGSGFALIVLIDPPLPGGDHWREFSLKEDAWAYARVLWTDNRLGFSDQTTAT